MKETRPARALFENVNGLKAEDIQQSDILKKLLKKEVVKSIEYAFENKKTFASIFEINESNCFVELHKNQWVPALETCIRFYIEEEDYESCNKITKLITAISKKKSSKLVNNEKEK
jgi:hypothetical protein